MEVSWDMVSNTANVAQMTGLNALDLIVLIGKAANNARMHRRRCRQFAQWLRLLEKVLNRVMNNTEWMKLPEIKEPLEVLEEALKRAFILVDRCQNRSYLYLLAMGYFIAKQLEQSRAEINDYLFIIPLIHLAVESKDKMTAIDGFKQLLDEAAKDITNKTTYKNFAKTWGRDQRFKDLSRKDRAQLLNERVVTLRKALEEEVKATEAASNAIFKVMLRERGDINSRSHWSMVRDSLCSDSRYRAVKKRDREALFNEYLAEMRAAEQEAEPTANAKSEEEVEIKVGLDIQKVFIKMANKLWGFSNYQSVCIKDDSYCEH